MTFDQMIAYATLFPLFPLTSDGRCSCGRASCKSAGKHPMIPWSKLEKGQKRVGPVGCGYGIATGERSGVIVIDTDVKADGEAGLEAWRQRIGLAVLPETLTVRTPTGGMHRYYEWPGFRVRSSAGEIAPSVDVRADGGFVVCPGSPHRNGGVYVVEQNVEIARLYAAVA